MDLRRAEIKYCEDDVKNTSNACNLYNNKRIKIKQWFKRHKKEILVGVTTASITALSFLIKDKKIQVKGGLNLDLRFKGYTDDEDIYYGGYKEDRYYASMNVRTPDFTINELGKLGNFLKESFPKINDTTKIEHLLVNYRENINTEE